MKIWVADELGQIKTCSFENTGGEDGRPSLSDAEVASSTDRHNRGEYVQIMTHVQWDVSGKSMSGVAVARRGGLLQILDPTNGKTLWSRVDPRIEPDDMFVSLEEKHGHLFWCTNHGYYGFLRVAAESVVRSALGLLSPNPLPVEMNKFLAGPVARARCHPRFAGVFAFGGKDVDLQIWEPVSSGPNSLQEQKLSWRAKNLKNDEYGLRQAIWISDLRFLDEERRALGSGYKVVVCTRFHQIRVYDTLVSRRPIINVEVCTSPIVSMTLGTSDSEVIFADSHGKVTSFSLDKCIANGNFTGATGMVLSLDVMKPHGTTGIVACVGLDRFLRLYDMSTRASLGNMYCKTKMTSVLIVDGSSDAVSQEPCGPTKRKASQDSDSSDENEETDQIWSRLPKVDDVGDVSTKRRRTSERTTRSRDN